MSRKQNFQSIAWFWDLYQRKLLDMAPPYQRRSVWNQSYKDYFIDTILLGYPAPAIFLYEEIDPNGRTTYHVVDGKQRLTTIFEFANNHFPVPSNATREELRDKYFIDLPDEVKRNFWAYPFSVEYLATTENTIIDNVFDRINRNTAKLTPQELRHAKYSGEFIKCAEDLAEWMYEELSSGFPNITPRARRQMKDVELVAHFLLLLEKGPRGYSTAELDVEFNSRDDQWEARPEVSRRFRKVVNIISDLTKTSRGEEIIRSRLRNQADFYSLFGAIDKIIQENGQIDVEAWADRLSEFTIDIENEQNRTESPGLRKYYEAARSASNDTGPRQTRVLMLTRVLKGLPLDEDTQ